MKTFVAICAVLACVQGNAISQQKCPVQGAEVFQRLARLQLENINLRKAAGEEVTPASLGLPASTEECDWTSGLSCAADIGWAVWDCSSAGNEGGPQSVPGKCDQGRRHLHRTRQEEDRHCHGCGLRFEATRAYSVWIWGLMLIDLWQNDDFCILLKLVT